MVKFVESEFLNPSVDETMLLDIFAKFGQVKDIRLIRDKYGMKILSLKLILFLPHLLQAWFILWNPSFHYLEVNTFNIDSFKFSRKGKNAGIPEPDQPADKFRNFVFVEYFSINDAENVINTVKRTPMKIANEKVCDPFITILF